MLATLKNAAIAAIMFGFATTPAWSAQLIMIDSKGCAHCARWDREIGAQYSNSTLGKIAPLRRVDARGKWPSELKGVGRDYFTPTFVLIDGGKEIGRIRGYTGKDWFWKHLLRFATPITG
jgi:hypothetical protein